MRAAAGGDHQATHRAAAPIGEQPGVLGLGPVLLQHGVDDSTGLRGRHTGLQTDDDRQVAIPGLMAGEKIRGVECPDGHRQRDLGSRARIEAAETSGGHADDDRGPAVDRQSTTQDLRIAAELSRPVAVADDGHQPRTRTIVVGQERASDRHRDPEDVVVVAADREAARRLDPVCDGDLDAAAPEVGGGAGKDVGPCGNPLEVGIVAAGRRALGAGGGEVELAWRLQRQCPQHHGFEQRKNGGVGANAERQREHDHGREPGRAAQHAYGVAQILHGLFDPRHRPHCPCVLLRQGDVAKGHVRLAARLVGRDAAGNAVGDVLVEVIADVAIELLEGPFAAAHVTLPSGTAHPSAGRRIRAIARASRSHLPVSISSCFRPLAVSR